MTTSRDRASVPPRWASGYEDSLYKRIDPQLQQDRERLRQQLSDQGIKYGTEAYDRAIAAADRQTTDTRLGITAQGGQEQKLLNDMAAQRAGFQNAAQKQAFEQSQGKATFANAAQQQAQKDLSSGTVANQAQKDAFTQAGLALLQFGNAAQAQELQRQQAIMNAQNASRQGSTSKSRPRCAISQLTRSPRYSRARR